MVSKSTVQNDPIMSTVVKDDTPMFSWKGHDERILVYPVDFDKQYNVTCTHPQQLSDQATSNVNSATAVGKKLHFVHHKRPLYTHNAELSISIQQKNRPLNRPQHLQRLPPHRPPSLRTSRPQRLPRLEIARHGRLPHLE